MPQRDHDIYASAPMRHLVAAEVAMLAPELQRCAGTHGLLLTAVASDVSPALPLLNSWVRLTLQEQGQLGGDLRARTDEPLPFVDGAFELIVLRHALERAPMPRPLLDEAVRVLARDAAFKEFSASPP